MPQSAALPNAQRNPPVDYAVAVWLGTPKEEIEKGLREGWIRRAFDARGSVEPREGSFASPPGPEGASRESSAIEPGSLDGRARIEALLRRLDPALASQTLTDAWGEAGSDEASRTERFADFLGRALNVTQDAGSGLSVRLAALESAAGEIGATARFVRFDGMTGRELEALAATEGGVRRALAEHSPWAFTGNRELARLSDVPGRYDRFDPDTGEPLLTDAWLGDRARHAAWRSADARGRSLEVEGEGWQFIDRAAGDAASVELRGAAGQPVHQVIFARDDGDRVTGGASTDRIHGGRGDDLLRGRGGDDLLEGGAGSDALLGGSGRDLLTGQQGDDELDGGAGDDILEGGSGSDELSGGRGDDLLRGGAGIDRYRFEAGDGNDTIDDDGGVVIVDDVTIAGTMRRSGDGWVSADGRFEFNLEDSAGERSTLLIRSADDAGEGAARTTVRLAASRAGDFGISLADAVEDEPDDEPTDSHELQSGAESGAAQGLADGFSPVPPPQRDNGGAEGDEAATDADATPALFTLPDASWEGPDRFQSRSLVDLRTVARALDAWSPPAPPDVGAVANDPVGVTAFDIGDALGEMAGDGEADSGAGTITLDVASLASPLRPSDTAPRPPPDLLLPRMH